MREGEADTDDLCECQSAWSPRISLQGLRLTFSMKLWVFLN